MFLMHGCQILVRLSRSFVAQCAVDQGPPLIFANLEGRFTLGVQRFTLEFAEALFFSGEAQCI